MTDHSDLIERLREPCIDWNGEPIVDGSTPRTEVHCGLLREAADALSSQSLSLSEAREEIERLKGLLNANGKPRFNEAMRRLEKAERERDESQAEGRRLRAIIRAFEGGLVDNPPLAARDEGDGR